MKTTPSRKGFHLLPIHLDSTVEALGLPWSDDLGSMIEMTKAFYGQSGYSPPWISYLAIQDGEAVGGGAFVGAPRNGAVEIAYFTLPDRQGQGIATLTATALVEIARSGTKDIAVLAKTLPRPNTSARLLQRLGFDRTGLAHDHDIGEAWLWTLTT
ncbi:MAG: GNAT family N-acetyltransferase [Rhodobacteraceae bacterium]|nr:GNAT family N-acetyltransferase [Paracoccaceae bacterium]